MELPTGEMTGARAAAAGAEPMVVFDGVQKSYDGETLVVKGLDLAIAKGEFLTMLGPSGSGKTTCLMMLAGFEAVTHGEIRLGGRRIDAVPPHRRGIGMVFQNYALFPHMTVGENLAFPLEVRGVGRAEREEKIARALAMVRMEGYAPRRPASLSGGQRQRIALARALVFEPELVLMDEPLGALDKQLREHMQLEIKHLHESLGITVVYVTHDQSEALTMSDRVAVFEDGVIQQCAPPDALYERPGNSFVAGFLGENNRLPGRVEALGGGRCAVRLDSGDLIEATPVNVERAGERTLGLDPARAGRAEVRRRRRHRGRGARVHLHGRRLPDPAARRGLGRVRHEVPQRTGPAPPRARRAHPHRLGARGRPRARPDLRPRGANPRSSKQGDTE